MIMKDVIASACLAGVVIFSGTNQRMIGITTQRTRPIFTRSETSDECSRTISCTVASVLIIFLEKFSLADSNRPIVPMSITVKAVGAAQPHRTGTGAATQTHWTARRENQLW